MSDFCYLFRVRYSECDAQNVVFNGRYGDYVDIAVSEYIRAIWGDYDEVLLSRGLDSQVVSYSINWRGPARFDDVIQAGVRVGKIGTTSYGFEVAFSNYQTGSEIAEAEIVYVLVDANSYQKTPIPDTLRQQLEAGAPAMLIDHAGAT